MRLELALIVGILFFCSWCAYIVARMNSSVNGGPPAGASASVSASSLAPVAPSSPQGGFAAGAGGPLIGHANTRGEHQSRLLGASEPIPSAHLTPPAGVHPGGRNWPPYVSSSVDTTAGNYLHAAGAPGPSQQWQSFALPSHAGGASAPAHASQPLLLDYGSGQQLPTAPEEEDAGREEGEGPEEEGGVDDYPQTAAASGEEPVEAGEDEEEADAGLQPPPQTELEEVANRRSLDELQSDSSERDKDGRVIVTKRRHLINGRPVAARRRQVADRGEADGDDQGHDEGQEGEEEGSTAASSRVAHESAPGAGGQSEVDFEKLVDEIDQEDKLRKRAAAAAAAPEVVGGRTGVAPGGAERELIGRRSLPDTPPPAPLGLGSLSGAAGASRQDASTGAPRAHAKRSKQNKDSHEHSLQESLQAQQWDDDSATSGGAAIAPEAAPEIGVEEDQEEVSNIVERDQEARRLARMSRDLLLSPERVSRELDQEEEQEQAREQERRRRRRRRKRETVIRSSVPSSTPLSLPNILDSPVAAPVPVPVATSGTSPTSETIGSGREVHNGTTTSEREVGLRATPPSPARLDERQLSGEAPGASSIGPATGAPEQVVFPSNFPPMVANYQVKDNNDTTDQPQQLSGLEDMHVEVLANPPPAVGSPHAWPPVAISTGGTPLNGHAHLGGPQLASGSHKVKSKAGGVAKKKRKKKRKKKYKKASKSKMVDSKYKAASAYARKHASRHKKGRARKKQRKSEKSLVAQKKHFRGATRGNKFARGEGAHGAKKRANFYKDKGYKKRGFKKAYHKLETGDHRTYFDEFRDKDHNRKWKNFDDRHRYAQKKRWAGSDLKHLDQHKLGLAKAHASKAGNWRESAANKQVKEMDKYRKHKKSGSESEAVKSGVSKKKKKKKKVVERTE